jgi:hypothetical protein
MRLPRHCAWAAPRGEAADPALAPWMVAAGGGQPPRRALPAHAHDHAAGGARPVRHGHSPAAAEGERAAGWAGLLGWTGVGCRSPATAQRSSAQAGGAARKPAQCRAAGGCVYPSACRQLARAWESTCWAGSTHRLMAGRALPGCGRAGVARPAAAGGAPHTGRRLPASRWGWSSQGQQWAAAAHLRGCAATTAAKTSTGSGRQLPVSCCRAEAPAGGGLAAAAIPRAEPRPGLCHRQRAIPAGSVAHVSLQPGARLPGECSGLPASGSLRARCSPSIMG